MVTGLLISLVTLLLHGGWVLVVYWWDCSFWLFLLFSLFSRFLTGLGLLLGLKACRGFLGGGFGG